jgi:hypothetical protein
MDQLMVQVDEGGPRPHVGWKGKVWLKYGEVRRCWLLWSAPLCRRARPLQEGRALCCLLDRQGAQAPSGGLVISSSSFMQIRVDDN